MGDDMERTGNRFVPFTYRGWRRAALCRWPFIESHYFGLTRIQLQAGFLTPFLALVDHILQLLGVRRDETQVVHA